MRPSFARLLPFLLPYRRRIAAALVALVVAAGSVLVLGQGLRHVVDQGFGSGDPRLLNFALGGIIAVATALAVATFFRFYLMMSTGERVVTDLRRAVFARILALEPAYFDRARTGEVISRLTNDTTLLQQVIGYGLSMFVRNGLMMLGAAAMLFVTSWKLALLVLLGVPATLVPILLLGRRVRRLSRDSQDRVADVSAYVDEAVHEIRTVQAYVHEAADREAFGRHAEAVYGAGLARIRSKAFLIASVMLIAFCAVGIILWIGGHDVLAGRLTPGSFRLSFSTPRSSRAGRAPCRRFGASCCAPPARPSGSSSCSRRSPARGARGARRAAGRARGAGDRVPRGHVLLSRAAGRPRARALLAAHRRRRARRGRRAVRRRQDDADRAAPALLRPAGGRGFGRRRGRPRNGSASAAARWSRSCRRIR